MFVLVLIASTVMCADAQALAQQHVEQVTHSSAEPMRMVRKLTAEKHQQTTATLLTPRLVRIVRVTSDVDVPADVHVPHWDVQPFRFRLPPPVRA